MARSLLMDIPVKGTWPFMSSLNLQYPTKPHEVADDIESFIYVVLYMAFRFHQHKLSPDDVTLKDAPLEDQFAVNAANDPLSKLVDAIFYEDFQTTTGYFTGGATKETYIKLGEPPIRLVDDNNMLAIFLTVAYKALQTHYAAVNRADLEPYAVPRKIVNLTKQAASINPNDQQPVPPQRFQKDPFGKRTIPIQRRARPEPAQSSSSSSAAAPEDKPRRILDDHDAMQRLLQQLFKDLNGQPRDLTNCDKKFYDQFQNLRAIVGQVVQNSSGTKRTLSEVVSESGESMVKYPSGTVRKKPFRPHGQQLPTIPETPE
jgi:hypothetical protein